MQTMLPDPDQPTTYAVGDRVHVLGTRTGTVVAATDARGYSRVEYDDQAGLEVGLVQGWHYGALRPITTG